MSKDFKSNLITNIEKTTEKKEPTKKEIPSDTRQNLKFKLSKKEKAKVNRKSFPIYMDAEKIKELDKICKKTGYSRNELIDKMISYCIQNIEIE